MHAANTLQSIIATSLWWLWKIMNEILYNHTNPMNPTRLLHEIIACVIDNDEAHKPNEPTQEKSHIKIQWINLV